MDILLASQNKGKLVEMRQLLSGTPCRVVRPMDLGIHDAPEETGTTFIENACLKARHYSRLSGRMAVADDSGISVEALGGEPGLYSSRFGGEGASDDDRNRLLLEKLRGLPDEKRTARFTCAVAVASGDVILFECEEIVEGRIAQAPRGANGFGYDPIFYYPPFETTFGDVDPARKDSVSHRGKAFARLRTFLDSLTVPS